MAQLKYLAFFLVVLSTLVNATPFAVTVNSPSDANYLKGTAGIVFSVSDSNAATTDLDANIFYSTTTGAFSNPIAAVFDLNSSTCSSIAFSLGVTCTAIWNTTGISDGNYFVDINVVNPAENTGGKDSSNVSFMVDNTTVPSISGLSPANSSSSASQTVSFTVADSGSGISLSTVRVDINGTTSGTFASATHCIGSTASYSCSYTETKFDTNSTDYNLTVFAKDMAGNSAQAISLFKYLDSTAPAQVSGLTATAGDGQVSLSWTAGTATDLSTYNVYMGIASGFTTNANALITTVAAGTTSYTKTGLTNGTPYFFKVSAKDKSGNEGANSEEKSATPVAGTSGLSAPAISSSTHTNDSWSPNNDPQFSWNSVSGASYYSYEFNQTSDTEPTNTNDTTSTSFNPDGTQSDGIWYFHIKACTASACSSTSRFKVKIDRAGPAQPQDVSLTANSDGTVGISWSGVSDLPSGDNSGLKEYKIYRKLNDDTPNDSDSIGTTTSASFTDDSSSLNNGVRYFYWIRAFDNAGNSGTISGPKSVLVNKSGTSCSSQFSYNVQGFLKGGEVDIKVSSSKAMTSPSLKVRIVGVGFVNGTAIDYKGTSAQGTYNFLPEQDGKTAEVTLTSTDPNGVLCTSNKTFTVDSAGPTIEGISPVSGVEVDLSQRTTFSAKITDTKSGVESAALFYKKDGVFEKIGDAAKGANENYSVEVLPAQITDLGIKTGSLELKIQAKDNAGNISEKTFTINVTNVPATQEVYSEKEYSFNDNNLEAMLKDSGLEDKLITQAKDLIEKNAVGRKLVIVKGYNENYIPQFQLTFTNNSLQTLNVKIIEVIPKEIANSADKITSLSVELTGRNDFTVLLDDPVIEFSAQNVAAGQSVEFSYGLSPVSKENADKMISQNIIQKFASPPIVVNSNTDLSQSFKQNPGYGNNLIFLVMLGIIVLFVVFVAVAILGGGVVLHLHRKSKEVPLGRAPPAKKFGMGPMEKSSGDLHKWFEQKEVEHRPGRKFKFREKD